MRKFTYGELERLAETTQRIKSKHPNALIALCVREDGQDTYVLLKGDDKVAHDCADLRIRTISDSKEAQKPVMTYCQCSVQDWLDKIMMKIIRSGIKVCIVDVPKTAIL